MNGPATSDATTLLQAMHATYRRLSSRPCIGVKRSGRYRFLTYAEMERRVTAAALQLVEMGVGVGDRVAIVSRTRLEWLVSDQAVNAVGGVVVPIYPTHTASVMAHVLADSGAKTALVEGRAEAERARAASGGGLRLVAFDPVETLPTLRATGNADLDHPDLADRRSRVAPDAFVSFLLTSGTTGLPKGVLYDHRRALGALQGFVESLGIRSDDVALTFLPLSHALGRGSSIAYFHLGVVNCLGESFDTVGEDFMRARPTVAFTVPRVFEKAHERVMTRVRASSLRRQRIFEWSLSIARAAWHARCAGRRLGPSERARLALADALVFRRIRARLGGRVRVLWSGGATLAAHIAEFFALAGVPIRDVYGMSEFGLSHITPEGEIRFGSCGRVAKGFEARLGEDGEILVRARHGMCGYHNMPEETAAFRDSEGWMHTGDIGRMDEDGYLYITDRKKSLIVLSNGKKVAPGPLETRLVEGSPYVAQAVVAGEGRNYLVALVHPNRELQAAHGLDEKTLLERLQEGIAYVNRDLASFETIKRFGILDRPLSEAEGELTPTLKVRRSEVARRHAALIETLYGTG